MIFGHSVTAVDKGKIKDMYSSQNTQLLHNLSISHHSGRKDKWWTSMG